LQTAITKFSIGILYPYLKDYFKVKSLDGLVDANMHISGNFNHPTEIAASGNILAKQFSIIDNTDELLTAIDVTEIKM
ncbi:hypothetical protein ABTQ02_19105, partial [Acinetobacter baumannii]